MTRKFVTFLSDLMPASGVLSLMPALLCVA